MAFIPLRKVDAVQRLVYAAIDEAPDRSGEVFDYATSKPLFEQWSADLFKASGGLSFGNVRAMHNNVAAGKLTSLSFDDAAKRIEFVAEIVDDAEWIKVASGVYTGFSPGGKYAKRWKAGGVTRYTARPSEISLVDLPCIPTATFELVKAAGETELRKCLGDVGRFASLLDSLGWLAGDVASEALSEGDGSAIPGRLQAWLAMGAPILEAMASEEASEAVARLKAKVPVLPAAMMQMASIGDLAKAGARHSKADAERLQAIHDHAVGMGAECPGAMAQPAPVEDLKKFADERDGALADLRKLTGERDDLAKRVAVLEALPAPGAPRLMAVDKGAPVGAAPIIEKPGSFEEELAKVNALPPGEARRSALVKLAASTR